MDARLNTMIDPDVGIERVNHSQVQNHARRPSHGHFSHQGAEVGAIIKVEGRRDRDHFLLIVFSRGLLSSLTGKISAQPILVVQVFDSENCLCRRQA
jgi:hypothetical protein